MSDTVDVRRRVEQPLHLFVACLLFALLANTLTLFLLRNEQLFGMATIRERAQRQFRVSVQRVPLARARTQPMQLPDRADVIAAVQRDVASAVAATIADLPPATLKEPPPGSRLEDFAQAREAEATPPRAEAPTHLDAVEAAAALLGHGSIRTEIQIVARQVDPTGGGASISAATATSLQRRGPTGATAVAGWAQSGWVAAPPGPTLRPRTRPIAPPPARDVHAEDETRRLLDPDDAERATAWDPYFQIELTVYHPPTGEPGYFRLEVVPKAGVDLPVAPRDVVFVLDASKSMGQERFAQARQVMADAIAALPGEDRFTILAFQSRPSWWRARLQRSTPANRRAAAAWVSALKAGGRTDLYAGLAPALAGIEQGTRPVVVLLCSDGRPTAGERDSRVLINELTAKLGGRASIFAYGAGGNVNRYLLDLLTYRNRGAAGFGSRPQDMRPGLAAMERSVREPVYLFPEIIVGGAPPDSVYPRPLPDIYTGRATRVWGRLAPGTAHLGVQLLGWSQGQPREILAEVPVSEARPAGRELAQAWAQQRLLHLVDEITAYGGDEARMGEVARLGRTYGLPEAYVEAARGR